MPGLKRTMRKYGMNIIAATQYMYVNAYVKSGPWMPRTRLRRYLGQYGLRGEALSVSLRDQNDSIARGRTGFTIRGPMAGSLRILRR